MRISVNPLILLCFIVSQQTFAGASPKYYCEQGQSEFRAVDFETVLGPIRIALFDRYAPLSTENFVYYVNQGFYDNTLVHQIDRRFLLQAGRYNLDHTLKTPLLAPVTNEWTNGIKHRAMRVAMWRGSDPNSASSGFFINLSDNPTLNIPMGYAVFGEVVEGKDRIKRMQYQMMCQNMEQAQSNCRPLIIHSAKLRTISCASEFEATS